MVVKNKMHKKFALLSVFDKHRIVDLAICLVNQGYEIISTGGTFDVLKPVLPNGKLHQVADISGFPEILDGRVKTLHPKIFGGILCRRDHSKDVSDVDSFFIDIVVVNLYPFEKLQTTDMIDIGGVALLRAAAKNYKDVVAICDANDYDLLLRQPIADLDEPQRFLLAAKVFKRVSEYDTEITRSFTTRIDLKYGLNPHQHQARLFAPAAGQSPLQVLNGRPGYINLLDAFGGWQLVREACAALDGLEVVTSFKHTSPAGVGVGRQLSDHERDVWLVPQDEELSDVASAYVRARNGDPLSSFGDFVASSHIVDVSMASQMRREVCDGIIAPGYTPGAVEILMKKKSGNFIVLQIDPGYVPNAIETRQIFGFEFVQERNNAEISADIFSKQDRDLTTQEIQDLVLGNITLKYTQSNSIVLVFQGQVIGVGAGQQNRLDCVKIAAKKATAWFLRRHNDIVLKTLQEVKQTKLKRQEIINLVYEKMDPILNLGPQLQESGIVLCSDAFFPFRDNIDYLDPSNCSGVTIVCQPGGSIADKQVSEACQETNRKMIVTNIRLFTH